MASSAISKSLEFCRLCLEIAWRSNQRNINRADFLKLFAIAPHLAEHVFDVFDHYKRNFINYNNFLLAFCTFTKAPTEEKFREVCQLLYGIDVDVQQVDLIREIFCVGNDREVYRPELLHIVDLVIDNACNLMTVNIHDPEYINNADIKANEVVDILLSKLKVRDWVTLKELYQLIEVNNTFVELQDFALSVASGATNATNLFQKSNARTLRVDDDLHRYIFPESRLNGQRPWESEECLSPIQGYVYKQTWFLNRLKRRWVVIRNNMLYSFHKETSMKPNIVIPLCGALCDPIPDEVTPEATKPRFALKLVSPLANLARIIYLQTAEQRDRWIRAVRIAAAIFDLADHYQMSSLVHPCLPNVFECKGAMTGHHYMLKFIDKSLVKENDLASLRTECGVLRFADHHDIAQSVAIYEDRAKIYILRHFIPRWVRLDEIIGVGGTMSVNSVALIMRQAIAGLQFLHSHGMVLGAFGPANIVVELDRLRPHRIQLVDIGLRKFFVSALDDETHSFIAPEAELRAQFGPKADMWSVGAIIYRLLTPGSNLNNLKAAKDDKLDLIRTQGSPEVLNTLKRLLNRNPSRRYSASDTLRLRWICDAAQMPFQMTLPKLRLKIDNFRGQVYGPTHHCTTQLAEAGELKQVAPIPSDGRPC